MRKEAYGTTCEGDVGEPGSEGVVPIPFTGDDLERVDVSVDLTFIDIEDNVGRSAINCWTISRSVVIFSTEFVTMVPLSAYHLLGSLRTLEALETLETLEEILALL